MNRILQSFNRYQQRPKYEGPDSVVIDGETRQIKEPIMGDKVQVALLPQTFKSVIRQIKTASLGRVKIIQEASSNTLKRLGKNPNPGRAVVGIPEGSDQGNVGSLVAWFGKIQKTNKQAIRQVIKIEATASKRIEG